MKIKKMGQIFTPEKIVNKMINISSISKNKSFSILEPSAGDGIFYKKLFKLNKKTIGIELDKKLALINKKIIHSDYFQYCLNNKNKKFNLIIGNPPYVDFKNIDSKIKKNINLLNLNLKNRPNLYQYFLLNCLKTLKNNGEIVFIIPADVFLKTSSKELVQLIKKNFSILYYEIIDENIWKGASITTAIIKLIKKQNHKNKIKYFINGNKIFFGLEKCIKLNGLIDVKVGAVPKNKKLVITSSYNGINFVYSKTVETKKTIKYNYEPKKWIRPLPKAPSKQFKKIFVNTKTRAKKPFFIHNSNFYDGSILCIYFNKNINIIKILNKLNKLNWELLSLKRNGRLILSQSILISLFCNDKKRNK